jgi:glutamate dehydrogenase
MIQRAEKNKAELIERAAGQALVRLGKERGVAVERFIREFYANVPPDDLRGESVDALFGAALSLWNFGQQRRPGHPKLRVHNPHIDDHGWRSPHSIVEIVNDDMPFLVDSVTAALNQRDLTVYLVIHPVLRVERDAAGRLSGPGGQAESWMQVRISEQSDPAKIDAIGTDLERVLADVRAAVADWRAMRARVTEIVAELNRRPPPLPADEVAEGRDFLAWMDDDHYTYLGYREYAFVGQGDQATVSTIPDSGLGVLRDDRVPVFAGLRNLDKLPLEMRQFLGQSRLLMVTKANRRATVHRPAHLDTIGVKTFDESGALTGERLFVGLLTSVAYNRSPREIPLLRRKVANVLARTGFAPSSHDGKALQHILDTFPRDELFQISEDELLDTALGILHLQERQRIALFVRRDPFERFVSCLVYLPRDRYNTDLRLRFQGILARAFRGRVTSYNAYMTEAALGRLQIVIETTPGDIPDVDLPDLEQSLVEAGRSWNDLLQDALVEAKGEEKGLALLRRYADAFPIAYRERFNADAAVFDIGRLEEAVAGATLALNLYRPIEATAGELRLKLYNGGAQIALSDVLPTLEHMGLRVVSEMPYRIDLAEARQPAWLHDFTMLLPDRFETDLGAVRDLFHEAYGRVWAGALEDDGFNQLVLAAGLDWREVGVLRAYCKYLRQAGIAFSQRYMEETLAKYPAISRLIVRLFRALFDPDRAGAAAARVAIQEEIATALEGVANLDEDRILRRFVNLVRATLRTNFFQEAAGGGPKPYLSFKLDSHRVKELPLPRPLYEIFVYSPRVEAIHLRGGKVARGGIRWSDRREDFRTEVLGLMKAQMVKNAVIVPVGSKGGFVVKKPPAGGGRDRLMAEVVECYKTLMRGLLDLTDNLEGGVVVPPPRVVRRDDDDPYLVVAADKGTATFSDIANGVATEYGFWLGDAFASGGSAGYDHKKMAITARGAWESVKRHFRERGKDIQQQDVTVLGVGDMSGDVFGNAMLLSPHIRLVGAFNHQHIFIDPEPDAAAGLAERQRLFALPRSAWSDYDPSAISPGGGVFERSAKSIRISAEMQARFGIADTMLTPAALIHAMLKAPVDLLWLGGIGTFVKAHDERHAEVGDRANDALRVDARDVRAAVVGEGANLGFTQRGRIEYALTGGRNNTDAVDNSAGVDCSDHEVNIKILLNDLVAAGDLTVKQRDRLLVSMTEEVAQLVLRDNYQQAQALSIAEAAGWRRLDRQNRFMRALERAGQLDRAIEFLPDDEAVEARLAKRQGLTRPELAVLLAYAKMSLYQELLPSDLPDDPQLVDDLLRYFPEVLRQRYAEPIARHRLRREIIATVVTNSLVNRVGPTFVHAVKEKTGMPAAAIARAYAITRGTFRLRDLWNGIQTLDNHLPAETQVGLLAAINELAETGTLWFLRHGVQPLDIAAHIDGYGPGIATLSEALDTILTGTDAQALARRAAAHAEQKVPSELARSIARLEPLAAGLDIVRIAKTAGLPVVEVGRTYFAVGERFALDWLRGATAGVPLDTHWDRMAVAAILDDINGHQRELTMRVLDGGGGASGSDGIAAWLSPRQAAIAQTEALFADLRQAGGLDLAKLAVANRQLRSLIG